MSYPVLGILGGGQLGSMLATAAKKINIKTDTTFLLALEAQKRGYKIYWYETKSLHFINSKLFISATEVKFYENKKKYFKIIKKKKFDFYIRKRNYF